MVAKSLLKCSAQWKTRNRSTQLHLSEIITVMIEYHESGYRCFKDYYAYVLKYHLAEFPKLVSYERFIALMKRTMPVVFMLFAALRGKPTNILFADSTPYAVCKTARKYGHKVFGGLAALSKNSMGWFYGLKLHFLFNYKGEIVCLRITPAYVDYRKGLKGLIGSLMGRKLFIDRGYLGKDFFEELWNQGLQVITRLRKNMKNKLMPLWDRFYLDKRMTLYAVYQRFRNWSHKDVWQDLFEKTQPSSVHEWMMIDATIVRAHVCSAGYSKGI